MKTYINPNTIVMNIEAETLICAGSPTSTGGDPKDAQAPMRQFGGGFLRYNPL